MGFSRQEYGVGCHALLQGTFLTQGLNPHLCSSYIESRFFTTERPGGSAVHTWTLGSLRKEWREGSGVSPISLVKQEEGVGVAERRQNGL